MTIFQKILLLFCVSIALMYYLSVQTDRISDEKIEVVYKQKYLQASRELFRYLVDGDMEKLNKRAKELEYKKVDLDDLKYSTIYDKKLSFGEVKVVKVKDRYYLYLKYLDDSFVFFDNSQVLEAEQKKRLNYLIVADVLLLMIMFFIIIRLLKPIKDLSKAIERFGRGEYSARIKEKRGGDEISKLTREFNKMAKNLDALIKARIMLLRDISHELRTPIAKMKLSVEMIQKDKYSDILKKAIFQMDSLTNELLQIEKLNSNRVNLDMQIHSIDTILGEALSMLMIEDEDSVKVDIKKLFKCKADKRYISIAIKNLLDNALKYSIDTKAWIAIEKDMLCVSSRGSKLERDLEFYLQTFTQDDSSRGAKGYGLGLNIVDRILKIHNFKLRYSYQNGYNTFYIIFG